MGLRPLTGDDVGSLQRFVLIAAFPPWRATPANDALLNQKIEKWLGGWGGDLGVGWEEGRQLAGAAWARRTDLAVEHSQTRERLPEVIIGVLPERRGQQVGTRLMEGLEGLAVERQVPGLSLRVSERNPVAIRVYEKVGFIVREERPDTGQLLMVWEAS